MGDSEGHGSEKTSRKLTCNIGVPLLAKGLKILLAGFAIDKPDLTNLHELQLDILVFCIRNTSNVSIIGLEGRASETGPEGNNLWLSEERAHAVQRYLRRRQIFVKEAQMPCLGDKYPLEKNATCRGDKGKEIAANRSVMITVIHPPLAVARASRMTIEYKQYQGDKNYIFPKQITLDGSESLTCTGWSYAKPYTMEEEEEHVKLVSFFWQQIEPGWVNPDKPPPSPKATVHLFPRDANPDPDSLEQNLYLPVSSDPIVKFNVTKRLLDNAVSTLKFRLTVADENQLTSTGTVLISIKRTPQPKPIQWGLKMRGSVSYTALGPEKKYDLGPAKLKWMGGIGGMFAFGQLKKGRLKQSPVQLLCFFGLGGGLSGGLSGVSKSKRKYDGGSTTTWKNLKPKNVKDFFNRLGMDYDDDLVPFKEEDFQWFTCQYTDFKQFDNTPATIGTFGVSLYFVGTEILGYINLLNLDTDPEWIDVGGPQFILPDTTIGVEAKANIGIVKVFSEDAFSDWLANFI